MAEVLTIKADDPSVLSLYHKQKLEFRFQQKSDNDFLYFLLDTTMRVISIVEQLTPVFEVVSAGPTKTTVETSSSPHQHQEEEEILDMETNDNQPELPLPSQSSPVTTAGSSFSPKVVLSQLATSTSMPANIPTFSLASMHRTSECSSSSSEPSNLTDINKTISQLQRELDTVSQALEISRTSPAAITTTSSGGPTRSSDFGAFLGRNSDPPPILPNKDPGVINNLLGTKDGQLDIIKQLQESLLYNKSIDFKVGSDVKTEPLDAAAIVNGVGESEQRLQQLVSSLAASGGAAAAAASLNNLPLLKKNPLSMLHLSQSSLEQNSLFNALCDRNAQSSPDGPIKTECSSTNSTPNLNNSKSSPNNDRFNGLIGTHHLGRQVSPLEHVGCYVCGKVFRGSSRAQNLKRHFNNVHLKLKPFRCNVCGMLFGLKYNLKSHISRAHAMISFPNKAESLVGLVESKPEPPLEPLASLPPSLAPMSTITRSD